MVAAFLVRLWHVLLPVLAVLFAFGGIVVGAALSVLGTWWDDR